MDNSVLLTYIKNGKEGFDWFQSIEDMEVSIIDRGIKESDIKDKLIIHNCTDIDLSRECKVYMGK